MHDVRRSTRKQCSAEEKIRIVLDDLRGELLDGEIFYSLRESQIIIEGRRQYYNTVWPQASLDDKPPAPEVFVPGLTAPPSPRDGSAPSAALPLAPRPSLN